MTAARPAVVLAACASAAAGLVHAAAAGAHEGQDALVGLFAAAAVLQLAFAGAALVRPTRPVLAAGAALNVGAVAVWAASRTTGVPFLDALREAEAVSTQDLLCAGLGAVAAVAALAAVARPPQGERPERIHLAMLGGTAALLLAVPAITAGHSSHGAEVAAAAHDHGVAAAAPAVNAPGTDVVEVAARADGAPAFGAPARDAPAVAATVAGDGHSHEATAPADHGHAPVPAASDALAPGAVGGAPAGPIIRLDDPRVTAEQRDAAQRLVTDTHAAMAGLTDEASVVAAGYRSIGDGRTGYEHFVHWKHLADGVALDPARIESIVLAVAPDGTKQVVSGMYILPLGQTMADVPDVAGELTTWHDHQDLCWDGNRVVGRFRDGACRPAGQLAPTPPMLHVWLTEHPCGPFAGIEGHGAGCATHDATSGHGA